MTESPALDPAVGLCSLCRYARLVRSGRGSRFWLCERAANDRSLRKYPVLPRTECHAFDAGVSPPPCGGPATGGRLRRCCGERKFFTLSYYMV